MVIEFDRESWAAARPERGGGPPDWHVLHSRLRAGYAANLAVSDDPATFRHVKKTGSFNREGAVLLASLESPLTSVNFDVSDHGKPDGPNNGLASGDQSSGGRG